MEKATSELHSVPSTTSDEVTKQHAEELRALEERLVSKHQEELDKATKAQESQPAAASGTAATSEDQKVAIDAAVVTAVAAKESELRTKHDAAIEKAVENGRLEGTMKLRLKDTQLVRSQNRVKELEKQIEEWKKAGVITSETATEPASTHVASPSVPVRSASASAPSPTTAAPPRGPPAGSGVPRKPPGATAAAGNATGQPVRGRGRGVGRGTIGIRGAAAPGVGRGAGAAGAGAGAGVAIMGAASKRTREEGGEASTEDSLSKRLKPATAATATTTATTTTATIAAADGSAGAAAAGGNTGGKPITLQRNRVQPS